MSDDFVQFNLDRPPKADVKSNEQMHHHSVEKAEDYPPLEKAVFIMMIGEEIQKLSVIQNIPELIKEDYEGCLSKIIPKMNQGLVQGSIEYHLAASKSVQKILKQNTIQPVHFKVNFLKTILKSMDNRDLDAAKTWLETLLEAIKILKEDVIIEDILPVAEAKSRHTEPVFHRVMSCRMLGRIAEYCSTYTVQKSVLGCVQALCQDVDKSVRATMCLQLSSLTRPLLASYDRDLLPLLNDCVNDEQIEVRAAAYCALVESLALVNQDILKQSFLPMAKKIIEQCLQTVQDGIFLIDLTEQYGNLCLGLEPVMNEQDKIWFAEAYLKLADLASSVQMKFKERVMERGRLHAQSRSPHNSSIFVDSRVNCALNMPNIVRFCRGIGNSPAAYFTRNIYPLMCMLCSDSQYAVRRAIASVMHQIAATLGKSNSFILKEFIKLLNDDSEDVLQALIPNIKNCLQSFSESENFSPDVVDDKSIELTRSLLACESEVMATYNWRLQTEYFRQLEVLMRCLPSSFIYSQFVQLLRKRLFTYRTVECRVAIVRTLLVFLRYNTNMNQRTDIRNSIITDLCCSKNFYNRSIYVRSIPNILEIFSSAYFRTHFFIPTIALMDDKVANIRFMMCDLMPMLKCIAVHEKNNSKFLSLVDAAIEKTSSERDRLVLEHIASMNKVLDKVKLDEKDPAKIKEEKILDAIVANAKDVKSHFANLSSRAAPMRNAARTIDMRDIRSLSSRSLDSSRLGVDFQQPSDCSSPAPASASSSQLTPDIVAYDTCPKFHANYSNVHGHSPQTTSHNYPTNSQTLDKIVSNEETDSVSNTNFNQINELVQKSNFDKMPNFVAASNDQFPNFDSHQPTSASYSPPNSNFYQFTSHEADRNNDIIPNLNFPSFNHVRCSDTVAYDLDTNSISVSLDNNGAASSYDDLRSRNGLGQDMLETDCLVQNLNFQNCNPNTSAARNNSNSNQVSTNERTRNDPPNARCISPDIIKNSKSSLTGHLPDIALNHHSNSPVVNDLKFGEIEVQDYENYDYKSVYVIENSCVAYLEEGFGKRSDECMAKNQSLDTMGGDYFIQSNETENFPRRSYLSHTENIFNDTSNSFIVENPSTEFQENFSNENRKYDKFVKNPSIYYRDETYNSLSERHQRHETHHNHGGKVFETSIYSEDNTIKSNETYDPNNVHTLDNQPISNQFGDRFPTLNETFESISDVQNSVQNFTRNSRKFIMNSSSLLNNNFETTAPATYTYSYIVDNSKSSSMLGNLENVSSNLQYNSSETSKSIILNVNEIKTANLSNRIEDADSDRQLTISSPTLINESPSDEASSEVRNSEFVEPSDGCKADIDNVSLLENNETIVLQSNRKTCSPHLSLQNNVAKSMALINDMSAKPLAQNITFENGNCVTVFEKDKNKSSSALDLKNCEESYSHTSSVPNVLSSATIHNNNNNVTDNSAIHSLDETVLDAERNGCGTHKETSHVIDIENDKKAASEPNLVKNFKSIITSKSESNMEEHRIATGQSLLKKGDILPKEKVSNINKSPIKSSKNASSCIPTMSKSPRRSLFLDSDCSSGKTSTMPSRNARRSLVLENGCNFDHSSIKKSHRNSLNFDGMSMSSGLSIQNKYSKFSSVENDSMDSNIITKTDDSFGPVESNENILLGSQEAAEPRKPLETSGLKPSSLACLQKTGELRKSSKSLVSKRSIDKIPFLVAQNTSISPFLKPSNKKATSAGYDEMNGTVKPIETPLGGPMSNKCANSAKVASENNVSGPSSYDRIVEDGLKNVEEPKNSSFSKLTSRKVSENGSLITGESKNHSDPKTLSNNISEANPLQAEESYNCSQTSSLKLFALSEKRCIRKLENAKKSSQNSSLKLTNNVQPSQKSLLPVRAAAKNETESQVSKRHSLGETFSNSDVISSKGKSAGRPQSLVINSSRLPVRSGTSSSSSLGISRTPR